MNMVESHDCLNSNASDFARVHTRKRTEKAPRNDSDSPLPRGKIQVEGEHEHHEIPAERTEGMIMPFTLLGATGLCASEARAQTAAQCNVAEHEVLDVFPCTPLQEGMMAMTVKRPGKYVRRWVFCLEKHVPTDHFCQTWNYLVDEYPILRTRIIQILGQSMLQAILANGVQWSITTTESIGQYVREDKSQAMGINTPLVQFSLVTEMQSNDRFFVLTMHHAVVDGVSIKMLLDEMELRYHQGFSKARTDNRNPGTLQTLVKHRIETEREAVKYWERRLEGADPAVFPKLPSPIYDPKANEIFEYRMTEIPRLRINGIQLSTAVWSSWAILQSCYTHSSDVVFGVPVTGRQQIPIPGIEKMMAPTVATVPLLTQIDWRISLEDFLQQIQTEMTDMLPFAHVGLQRIRQIGSQGDQASRFQTILGVQRRTAVQPRDNTVFQYDDFHSARDLGVFNGNALMIECQIDTDALHLLISFDSTVITRSNILRLAQQLEHVLRQVCDENYQLTELSQIETLSPRDIRDVQLWNAARPVTINRYVHDLIADNTKSRPDAPAICAWDGSMTYRELDDLSTRLALHLVEHEVCRGVIVPLCFDRSRWAFISMLAVMKTGAAFVFLDRALPLERMREIVAQTRAQLIVASKNSRRTASELAMPLLVVDHVESDWLQNGNGSLHNCLERFQDQKIRGTPADPLYIAFTSGSTGKPKGAVITHSAYASVACSHKGPMGLDHNSRMLQFASYSFDASNFEGLTTFIAGGCLCIPSEHMRKNDLAAAITTLQVNAMFLTPTVSRLLTPADISSVKIMLLGGEPITDSDIAFWNSHLQLKLVYGPTECSAICCCLPVATEDDAAGIGYGTGASLWVVDPSDHHKLAPVGATGELILEGPVVGAGYLNDAEKTAIAFVDPPRWLSRITQPGGEIFSWYRTGDLVQYREDGLLKYIGRKDQQVKLHGQRFELAEAEFHLRNLWKDAKDVVAAIVTPAGGKATLAAFVWMEREEAFQRQRTICEEVFATKFSAHFSSQARNVQVQLHDLVPSYMVPSLFIPLHSMPQRVSGKIDKARLCSYAATFTRLELEAFMGTQSERREASTWAEEMIGKLVQDLLKNDIAPSPNDNFFRLGGDSIVAMNLVQRVRRAKMTLNVSDVFKSPKLRDLALLIQQREEEKRPSSSCSYSTSVSDDNSSPALNSSPGSSQTDRWYVAPFSMINTQIRKEVNEELFLQAGISPPEIEDIYPCTPLQEGLMSLSIGNPGTYIRQDRYLLPSTVSQVRLKNAWTQVVQANPILRTRIYQPRAGEKALQVVLNSTFEWEKHEVASLEDFQDNAEKKRQMGFLDPLIRLAIITERKTRLDRPPQYLFVITLHHALYDSLSIKGILDQVEESYKGLELVSRPFAPFVEYIERSLLSGKLFWSTQLAGSAQNTTIFPSIPEKCPIARPVEAIESTISGLASHCKLGYTLNIQLRAAWAATMFQYTSSDDVVFGVSVTGRNSDFPGIDQLTGPTFATIPVRAIRDDSKSVEDTFSLFQSQMVQAIPFEHCGLQNISSLGEDAAMACRFQTLLIIQSTMGTNDDLLDQRGIFSSPVNVTDQQGISQSDTYALTIECSPYGDDIHVRAIFDPIFIPIRIVERMLQLFSHIFHEMGNDPLRSLGEISMISMEDQDQLTEWNLTLLAHPSLDDEIATVSVHGLIQRQCKANPSDLAVCAWDGNLTYEELNWKSSLLATHLVQTLGIAPEAMVPLCFEKSLWTTVAILGVMKAGAAFVLLDPSSQPADRMQAICMQVKSTVVISSMANAHNFDGILVTSTLVLNEETFKTMQLSANSAETTALTTSGTDNALYGVFTSGSTGQPKGIIIEHRGYVTTALARQGALGLHRGSRVLQFASYAFDVSIENTLDTLIAGGCLCIPSEAQRKSDFSRIADEFQVTYADLTPSVARLLAPSDIPTVETMILGGEAMASEDVARWASRVRLVNAYGPAECAVTATVRHVKATDQKDNADATNIGRAFATAATWVVDPSDYKKLLPIGLVGELVIEGPLVGRGYLNNCNEAHSATSFVQEIPAWRLQFDSRVGPMTSRMYCTGDLVQYNADGSLRYLGRKDQQVKIHGQRIELGEIETQLRLAIPLAIDVLVDIIYTGSPQRPSLISFINLSDERFDSHNHTGPIITSPTQHFHSLITDAEATLSALVPRYMIPIAFISVRRIPQTAAGKADRRKLCQEASELSQEQMKSYMVSRNTTRAPSTTTERKLQSLWAEILHLSPQTISASDGFFHIGGNSILAMKLAGLAKQEGIQLSVPDLFENKSLETLASELDASVRAEPELTASSFDWEVEAAIPSGLKDRLQPTSVNGFYHQNEAHLADSKFEVVLTGSTGHLGGEILRQLLCRADVRRIHCVAVRKPDQLASHKLLPNDHFDWRSLFEQKVKVYQGDLASPRVGLSSHDEAIMLSNCRVIIHCGALVSFVRSYELMRDVNVASTKYLAGLAVKASMSFHYISTVGVNSCSRQEPAIIEETSAAGTYPLSDGAGGYIASKWVSEIFLEQMNARYGLPVSIHRPSNIIGPNASKDDIINSLLDTCRRIGMVPRLSGWSGYFDLISFEKAASNIISTMIEMNQNHHGVDGACPVIYRHESGDAVIPIHALQAVMEKGEQRSIPLVGVDEWMENAKRDELTSDLVLEFLEMRKGKGVIMPLIQNNRIAWFSNESTAWRSSGKGTLPSMKARGPGVSIFWE